MTNARSRRHWTGPPRWSDACAGDAGHGRGGARRLGDDRVQRVQPAGEALARAARADPGQGRRARLRGAQRAGALAAARQDGRARRRAGRGAGVRVRGPRVGRVAARARGRRHRAAPGARRPAARATRRSCSTRRSTRSCSIRCPTGIRWSRPCCGGGCRWWSRADRSSSAHPFVAIDERAAGAAAAEHLRSLGHTRLAVLSLPFSLADRADRPLRLDARCTASPAGGSTGYGVDVGREVELNDRAHGEAAAGALLDGPEPPTGLLCMSDELAIGALRAAAARGLSVPRRAVGGRLGRHARGRAGRADDGPPVAARAGAPVRRADRERRDRPGRAAALGTGRSGRRPKALAVLCVKSLHGHSGIGRHRRRLARDHDPAAS